MRFIGKSQSEPPCLASARRDATRGGGTIDANVWGDLPTDCKSALRERLYTDQQGLCAYCAQRIVRRPDPIAGGPTVPAADRRAPERGGMSIEHWVPRSGYAASLDRAASTDAERAACGKQTLSWSNLLGVCVGRSVVSTNKTDDHCDAARGQKALKLHPCEVPGLAERFRYNTASGEILAAQASDADANNDIDALNLNVSRLKENRRQAIAAIQRRLQGDSTPKSLQRLWREATAANPLPPFAPAVAWYLAKKFRQKGLALPG